MPGSQQRANACPLHDGRRITTRVAFCAEENSSEIAAGGLGRQSNRETNVAKLVIAVTHRREFWPRGKGCDSGADTREWIWPTVSRKVRCRSSTACGCFLRNRSRGYRLDTLLLILSKFRQWQPMSWVKDRTVPTIIFGVLYCSFDLRARCEVRGGGSRGRQGEPDTIRPNFHVTVFANRLHMISD